MSIPTSLVIVLLVAAWLAVLVPMVARRRETVLETEDEGGHLRVLRRASESVRRRRPHLRRRTADGAESADSADSAELDDGLAEDEAGEFEGDVDQDEADQLDDELLDQEYDVENLGDEAELGDDINPGGQDGSERQVRAHGSHPYSPEDRSSKDPQDTEHAEVHEMAGRRTRSAPRERALRRRRRQGSSPYQADPYQADPYQRETAGTDGSFDDQSADDAAARYHDHELDEYEPAGAPADSIDAGPESESDERYRPVPQRRGRGGYDPEAAEATRAYRYSRRRRVSLFLLLMALAFTAAALLVGKSALWLGTGVFGMLLVGYLVYLRRQVMIEESIRQRRLAKLRRARQIRPEYHERAYTEDISTLTHPYAAPVRSAAAQISQELYAGHGRTVVDVEDDDPGFEDLEYYHPVTYRRAAGQ